MSPIVCPGCDGKGAFPPHYYDCSTCMGSGRLDTDGSPTDALGAWWIEQLRSGKTPVLEEFQKMINEQIQKAMWRFS